MACLVVVAACDPTIPIGPSKIVDMKPVTTGDLAGVDLAMKTYMATLPSCTPVQTTASQVYAGVFNGCSCHKTTAPRMASAADLIANLVNKMPRTAMMPLVTPGDVNRSYLIFRLTGEGDLIPGGSSGFMPLGGSKLNTSQMCQVVNWIRSGALP